MDKIFITGGSGFISSHFHEVLDHNRIVNYDIKTPSKSLKSQFIKGNVRDLDHLTNALKESDCNVVLALAAEHKDFGISRVLCRATDRAVGAP